MTGFAMTLERMIGCLTGVEPLQLTGMVLLRQRHSPANGRDPAHADRDTLRQATLELMAYTQRCQQWLRQVSQLPPVAVMTALQPEFGL